MVIFPGGFGTLNECMEVLALVQTGKSSLIPIVLAEIPGSSFWKNFIQYMEQNLKPCNYVSPHDVNFLYLTNDVEDACAHIQHFYKNYHSTRMVGDSMVLRVMVKPEPSFIERINRDFRDILREGAFQVRDCFPEEADEEEILALPRIAFSFNGKSFARLRKLVDEINGM